MGDGGDVLDHRHLQAHGLAPAGTAMEITMIDDGMTSDPEQFVTEIQIPVEGKESTENPKKVEKRA